MFSYKRIGDLILKKTVYYGGSFQSGIKIKQPEIYDGLKDPRVKDRVIKYMLEKARKTNSYSILVTIYNGDEGVGCDHTTTLKVAGGVRDIDIAVTELVQKLLEQYGCNPDGEWGYGVVIKPKGHNFTDGEVEQWSVSFYKDGITDMEKRDQVIELDRRKQLEKINENILAGLMP